ncbi:peptidoglycan-binding domain-containing protein [Priestia megaterium]|uniref:peptidoglycan-binding domain-containing protein n=1 Tax=Priestia megaterium TaxID=1404 RepID=UPI00203A62E3|nr:peptidoglycan-binding protein [Priestia megaterium]MCM3196899.1 peptidoglycan-binding protein [Priestia megaterium]
MAELLRKGDKGRSVKTLQRQLIRENNNALVVGEVDGEYGSETENAVLTFQKKHSDLGDTGVADLPTQARLIKVILLKEGSKGRGVKMIQEALIRFTINIPSGADGIYGPDTTKAVKIFQTQNGILADGQAGAVTLDTLDKALNVYYVGPGATGTIYTSVVRMVQSQLIQSKIDLPLFGVDGDYGTETTNGVKQFQKREGLPVDGVAGPRTMNLLDIEADHPLLAEEMIEFGSKHGLTNEVLDVAQQQLYVERLESNQVFKNNLPSGILPKLGADKLAYILNRSSLDSLVVVTGHLETNSNVWIYAFFDKSTNELTFLNIYKEITGGSITDKVKWRAIDVYNDEIIDSEEMFVDMQDLKLQNDLVVSKAIKQYQEYELQNKSLSSYGLSDKDAKTILDFTTCTLIGELGCSVACVTAGVFGPVCAILCSAAWMALIQDKCPGYPF